MSTNFVINTLKKICVCCQTCLQQDVEGLTLESPVEMRNY